MSLGNWSMNKNITASMSFRVLPNGNMSMVLLKTVLDLEAEIKFLYSGHISQTISTKYQAPKPEYNKLFVIQT